MVQDHIRYDILAQDALRGVIRKVLTEVAATGSLPGDHHFFITFMTNAPGVRISAHLRQKYQDQMTIVVQHQFWELKVTETHFEIGLSFSDTPEKLVVPFSAVRGFYDPSVNFELEFDTAMGEGEDGEDDYADTVSDSIDALVEDHLKDDGNVDLDKVTGDAGAGNGAKSDKKSGADVVSLDSFRKKN
ncbi:SspB family protein [Pararhizobium haloflavum]|uniref:SspB family protein n=1 Tax=Pararhizobium haloflavum TaxID=2037914 RepID=UPI000C190994|nr:SspB family protein [Pararhizobium haloflavum]